MKKFGALDNQIVSIGAKRIITNVRAIVTDDFGEQEGAILLNKRVERVFRSTSASNWILAFESNCFTFSSFQNTLDTDGLTEESMEVSSASH